MSLLRSLPPTAAAVVLLAAASAPAPGQEAGARCYDLRIVPDNPAMAPAVRAAERLDGPVVLTREPAGRASARDDPSFYRVERPGRAPWTPRGFTIWVEGREGTTWLGGASVAVPGGDGAASAHLLPHDDGRLSGRLKVALAVGPDGNRAGATIARVTAEPVPCDPPAVVLGDRTSPQ